MLIICIGDWMFNTFRFGGVAGGRKPGPVERSGPFVLVDGVVGFTRMRKLGVKK